MRLKDEDNIYAQLPETVRKESVKNRDYDKDVCVTLRPFDVDDTKFLMHSWMRSLRVAFTEASDHEFYENMTLDIIEISKLPAVRVHVACDSEQPWFILGYIVAKPIVQGIDPNQRLHVFYVFVKHAYRRKGIARAMLQAVGWEPGRAIVTPYWNYTCRDLKSKLRIFHNPWMWRPGYVS